MLNSFTVPQFPMFFFSVLLPVADDIILVQKTLNNTELLKIWNSLFCKRLKHLGEI